MPFRTSRIVRIVFSMIMPFRTSRILRIVFLMIWLSFVYPRYHPGWIGPIGEFREADFIQQQAYRYSVPLFPWLASMWRNNRLSFRMLFRTSGIGYVLTVICIPQVPFRLNWSNWRIYTTLIYPITSLPVLRPLFPLTFNMKECATWFCMFWLMFVCPRSNPGWIGQIDAFNDPWFISQPAYRYSMLAFNMKEYACSLGPFVPVG